MTQRLSKRAKIATALIAVAVALGLLAAWTSGLFARFAMSSDERLAAQLYESHRAVQTPREAVVEWIPLDGRAEQKTAVQSVLAAAVIDPQARLSPGAKAALVESLSRQIVARSSRSAEAYAALADQEPTRWHDESTPRKDWHLALERYEGLFPGEHLDPKDTRAALVRMMQHELDVARGRVIALGGGGHGARIYVYKARTLPGIQGFMPFDSAEDAVYWINRPAHRAFRLRTPKTSVHEILRRDGAVTCASVHLLLETEAGTNYVFDSKWYWDPVASVWACLELHQVGWDTSQAMYY